MTTERRVYTSSMRIVAILLVLAVASLAADKHPDRTRRDAVAKQIAIGLEHDGWPIGGVWATRQGCGSVCIGSGNHDCLRIWLGHATVQGIDRFLAREIVPGVPLLLELGFVEVEIVGMGTSASYPEGFARFSLQSLTPQP